MSEETTEACVVEDWGYKTILVKAVIAFDNEGNYLIHGSSDETYAQMRKAIEPIWDLNPETEMMQVVEFEMQVPDLEIVNKPRIKNANNS